MEIGKALQFVRGAVARKNYDVTLTHFRIANGSIQSYNGIISLSSPIDIGLSVYPKAAPFAKAIQSCDESVALHVTATGRLAIRSGAFRAYIDCLPAEEFPEVVPEGEILSLEGTDFLSALKVVEPFIGEDASRPWARGVLFRGNYLFVTNNIVLIQHWLPASFPVEVNVPQEAISELVRIGEQPERVQVSDSTVTFFYKDGRWLRSRLYATSWPDTERVLDRECAPTPLPAGFFDALDTLSPFTEKLNAVYFSRGTAKTSVLEDEGASVEIDVGADCAFNCDHLRSLRSVVQTIDLTQYPAPCIFYGKELRGAIVGLRL